MPRWCECDRNQFVLSADCLQKKGCASNVYWIQQKSFSYPDQAEVVICSVCGSRQIKGKWQLPDNHSVRGSGVYNSSRCIDVS